MDLLPTILSHVICRSASSDTMIINDVASTNVKGSVESRPNRKANRPLPALRRERWHVNTAAAATGPIGPDPPVNLNIAVNWVSALKK